MSQKNVDRWRDSLEDFLEGSAQSDWEAWLIKVEATMDPAIEWDASRATAPDLRGVYHGREAVIDWWRKWLDAWEAVEFEYELVDAGDQVVLLLDQRMRGRATGIEVPMGQYAHVATFKNGLITHWELFGSHEKALKAAGLSE
jgi:hypothetical protein